MKLRLNKQKRVERGLSLIEASMVLVLSAVVVAGVMAYYESSQNNKNLKEMTTQAMALKSEISGAYADSQYYDGINTALAAKLLHIDPATLTKDSDNDEILPGGFEGSGLQVFPYKNKKVVAKGVKNVPGYAIALIKIPASACTKFTTMDFGPDVLAIYGVAKWTGFTFNKTETVTFGPHPTPAYAAAQCDDLIAKDGKTASLGLATQKTTLLVAFK